MLNNVYPRSTDAWFYVAKGYILDVSIHVEAKTANTQRWNLEIYKDHHGHVDRQKPLEIYQGELFKSSATAVVQEKEFGTQVRIFGESLKAGTSWPASAVRLTPNRSVMLAEFDDDGDTGDQPDGDYRDMTMIIRILEA